MVMLLLACQRPLAPETVDHVIYLQALATREPMAAALRCDDIQAPALRGECRYFAAMESLPTEGLPICLDTEPPWDELCERGLSLDMPE